MSLEPTGRVEGVADPRGEQLDLTISRIIPAPRAAVWAALTQADLLKRWWAPGDGDTVDCILEARPGGAFTTIVGDGEGGERAVRGAFLELVEPERLIFTDAVTEGYRPSDHAFLTVSITLDEADGGTRYTAHCQHKDAVDRRKHEEAGFMRNWTRALDRLEAVVAAGG